MAATSVTDTTDWLLAQPIASTGDLDLSATLLTATFRPIFGGDIIAEVSSEDGGLVFVPAVGNQPAYFAISVPVKGRTWRIGRRTSVKGDIERRPDPTNPDRVEWLGRIDFNVEPGTSSAGVANAVTSPVLIPAQPYDGRLVVGALYIGPQGLPGEATEEFLTGVATVETGVAQVAEARTVVEDAVVQTGEDREAADSARAAAQTARTGAQTARTGAQEAYAATEAIRVELAAALLTIDVLTPPNLNFSRPAMNGSAQLLLLGA